MGILEWLGEAINPRRTGPIGIETEREPLPPTPIVWICFVLSLGALGGVYYVYFAYLLEPTVSSILLAILIGGAYMAAGYFLELNPGTRETWLYGTAFFEYLSTNRSHNRRGLKVILAPGRFVVWSLVNGWRWLRGERSPLEEDD